ncbi:MAG: hypothetical protein P8100_00710 [bacterium]|jgi:hypothetical protein
MGTNVSILSLAVESPESKHIWVLTNWQLDAGKIAVIKKRTDDLSGNFVELAFHIIDGTDQNLKILTRADLQNPVSALDPAHKVKVSAYENEQLLMTTEMDTGNAHHN